MTILNVHTTDFIILGNSQISYKFVNLVAEEFTHYYRGLALAAVKIWLHFIYVNFNDFT